MNVEEGTVFRLLEIFPIKYKELTYQIINCLNSSPLSKKAFDFYSIKNYSKNEKKLKDSYSLHKAPEDEFQKLKKEFIKVMNCQNDISLAQDQKIRPQDQHIKNLESDVSSLRKELHIT